MKLKKRMNELFRGSRLPVTFLTDFFVVNFIINQVKSFVSIKLYRWIACNKMCFIGKVA